MFERFLISLVKLYQLVLSPWRPASCRFYPTCSAYALESYQTLTKKILKLVKLEDLDGWAEGHIQEVL